jgi:dihydroorotate dehydrogenase (fumarate)
MRYAGLLYGETEMTVIANSGIHSANDVIKMILAGADAIQVVSTLYRNKIDYIRVILSELSEWMDKNNYGSLYDFHGKLSRKSAEDPFAYKRAQYVDILMKSEEIFKKYPMS